MKEKMKKISVLTFYREREHITSMLQELGVIHVELNEKAYSESIKELQEHQTQITRTLQTINDFNAKGADTDEPHQKVELNPDAIVKHVADLKKKIDLNRQTAEKLRKDRNKLRPWGDFNRERLKMLEENGIAFSFYVAGAKDFYQYDFGETICEVIQSAGKQIHFIVVEKGEHKPLPFELVQLPDNTLSQIDHDLRRLEEENRELSKEIRSFGANIALLNQEQGATDSQLTYELAMNSYADHAEGKILHLQGWYPETEEGKIAKRLEEEGVVFVTSEPTSDDQVPVKLKNHAYVGLFEPITRIFQLPNYYELDLTPVIAVFYPIFFAYCLGDAGYGLIILLLSLAGWFTFFRKARNMALLGVLLGTFTTIMGVVKSGSVFGLPITGAEAIPIFGFLSQFVVIPDDQDYVFNAFNVSLMIGVVQILTGVISSIVNKAIYQSLGAALPQVGKLLIISGVLVVFLADMQEVEAFSPYVLPAKVMLFSGIGIVLLTHDLSLSLVKRIGGGLLPLFFIFTGILGDTLSYVRLFALGVASSVLGLVVNQIGMQIMGSGWWGILLGIVFLLFGHTLNLALAVLGAFVHPLRLTFVEFYNNAQFTGGGVEYKPFKKFKTELE